ncbi:MAG: NAD/NADP octopine/nopaline dehydrogenase family protein [Actinomycetota bacterium]|nr:NAD/NADP octopine/nopaline dehydrogenase family protein [Actinomycetota bacterium]
MSAPAEKGTAAGTVSVAVLGAGHGGLALAGDLGRMGFEVTLFSFFPSELAPVRERGGVELSGMITGFGRVATIVDSPADAAARVDLLLIVAPALAHETYASLLAGSLRDGQTVVLNPGRTGGALEFDRALVRFGCRADIRLAEAQTFIFAAESRGPAGVEVLKEKDVLRVAALPGADTPAVVETLRGLYPQVEPAESVLETSINNVGGVVHPAAMLLNTGAIERAAAGEDVRFYKEHVNRHIASLVMEKIDREKVAVGRALGLEDVWTILDWYRASYGVTGGTLYEALQNHPYYAGFHTPTHVLGYNHVPDEVPNSLVPLASLAEVVGVPTPSVRAIVDLACVMTDVDWRAEGRTVDSLGLTGLDAEGMREFVATESHRTRWLRSPLAAGR